MTLEFNDSSSVRDGTMIAMTGSSTFGDPRRAERSADFESLGVGRIEMLRRVGYVYHLSDVGGGGQMTVMVTFSGFGEPIEFEVPDSNQVAPVTTTARP